MEKKFSTLQLTLCALFIALTCAATMVISIPIPATNGYVNIGDSLVIISGMLLGRSMGALTGGLGSALADLFLGYAHFAPITLVVKAIEGFVAGYARNKTLFFRILISVIAAFLMAVGYLVAEIFMYDLAAALASFPSNLLQGAVGLSIAQILYPLVDGLVNKFLKKDF